MTFWQSLLQRVLHLVSHNTASDAYDRDASVVVATSCGQEHQHQQHQQKHQHQHRQTPAVVDAAERLCDIHSDPHSRLQRRSVRIDDSRERDSNDRILWPPSSDEVYPLYIINNHLIGVALKPHQQLSYAAAINMSANIVPAPATKPPAAHDDPASASTAIDTDIEEEIASISEHISFDDSNVTDPLDASSAAGSGAGPSGAQPGASAVVAAKKRQLFAFGNDDDDDDDMDDMDAPMFRMDDALLDGGRIAEHFRVDVGPANPTNDDELTESNRSTSMSAPKSPATPQRKDVSPLNDDVILLNNDKISLTSLKHHQQLPSQLPPLLLPPLQLRPPMHKPQLPPLSAGDSPVAPAADLDPSSATTNQNTTNDVSEIGVDVEDVDDDETGHDGALGPMEPHRQATNSSPEADQSIDEILVSNASISVDLVPKVTLVNRDDAVPAAVFEPPAEDTLDDISLGSVDSMAANAVDLGDLLLVNRLLGDSTQDVEADSLDNMSDGVLELKQRILHAQMADTSQQPRLESVEIGDEIDIDASTQTPIKPMLRIEPSKEALDDISEVTEPSVDLHYQQQPEWTSQCLQAGAELRHIIQMQHVPGDSSSGHVAEANAHSFDSVISLNMLEACELRIRELEATVTTKEVCLSALSLQLQRSESLAGTSAGSSRDVPPPDSNSLAETVSTEYRTYQDECFAGSGRPEFHVGILERERLIEQLTEALQQSMVSRDQLQQQSDRTNAELVLVRRQLTESTGVIRRPLWMMRSGELGSMGGVGSGGQRISEISIDLVSESGDAEEQLVVARVDDLQAMPAGDALQLDRFQQSLSADERAVFAAMRQKFEQYMREEVERVRSDCEMDLRMVSDRLASERSDKELEINRLRQLLANTKGGSPEICELRRELESIHGREMEDLRTYFERKCADLEKQYSEEIFSQHSRRHSNDSASDLSDQEQLPDDQHRSPQHASSRPPSTPRRKTSSKADIWSSPTHRKITPTSIGGDVRPPAATEDDEQDPEPTVQEVEAFYRDKIAEINRQHEESVRMLKFRLKRFECRTADDEYMTKRADEVDVPPARATTETVRDNARGVHDDDDDDDVTSLKEIAAGAPGVNDSQVITQIVEEYDQRLQAQLALAKEDIVNALEEQIQALLSETSTDDSQWPPELILLREKFTAKSQLEIAQLQIAHKDEMDRMRTDFDKQLSRKQRRHTTFDENRDLDQIVLERDNLRELCHTFRWLLSELAKCVSVCSDDLNQTLIEELHKHGIEAPAGLADAVRGRRRSGGDEDRDHDDSRSDRSLNLHDSLGSTASSTSSRSLDLSTTLQPQLNQRHLHQPPMRLICPDVSGILDVIEDPSLVEFVEQQSKESSFNLNECVDRLKVEAMQLLELSEDLCKRKAGQQQHLNKTLLSRTLPSEKGDSCEEEDGLKSKGKKHRWQQHQNNSLNESILCGAVRVESLRKEQRHSLPGSLLYAGAGGDAPDSRSVGSASELTSQLNDLRNRLVVSETDRAQLRDQLDAAQKKHDDLSEILNMAKEHMEQVERQKEEISEGFGISHLKSPSHGPFDVSRTSYTDLQNTARSILNVSPDRIDGTMLLQQIEDFCTKLDRFVEEERHNKTDLQEQASPFGPTVVGGKECECRKKIDAAYKQKKCNSKLLEQQATEWQLERDEFTHEIDKLSAQLRDREKECVAYGHVVKEVEQMEHQIKELTLSIASYEDKKHKLEIDLKEHIDKIFVLREVIKNLEAQLDDKTASAASLHDQLQQLEAYAASQTHANESLHDEVEELKQEYVITYGGKIAQLEEQLRTVRPSNEHQLMMEQVAGQLRNIETVLVRKTRHLEALHSDICSASCSTHSEDVSRGQGQDSAANSPMVTPRSAGHFAPADDVQRIVDKLTKHSRAEEAAVKRIRDLEMQMATLRSNHDELQTDRDLLQEKMSEQILRISSLQSRLDEQRHRAEEIHRQGTSDLSVRVYDLQTQLAGVQELLLARDKQIVTLKSHLDQSKQIIDRQESDLATGTGSEATGKTPGERLQADLRARDEEIARLKERMRAEMISKIALPDLMETMLSEKNDEMDHLKERLAEQQRQLQTFLDLHLTEQQLTDLRQQHASAVAGGGGKLSARTLSDIVSLSEFDDESDLIRKEANPGLTQQAVELSSKFFAMTDRKPASFTELSVEPSPIAAPVSQQTTATVMPKPRHINFSLTDESAGLDRVATAAQAAATNDDDDTAPPSIVPQLQNEIAELQARLDALTAAADLEASTLKHRLDELQTEKSSIAGELNRHRDAASTLKLDLAGKSQAIAELLEEKRALQADLAAVRSSISQSSDLQAVEAKLLKEELVQCNDELVELRQRFDANRADNAELSRKIQILTGQNGDLQTRVNSLSEQLTKREKDALNSAKNEADYLARIAALQAHSQQTPERTSPRPEVISALRTELEATKTDLYERMIDFEKSQLDIQDLRQQLERHRQSASPQQQPENQQQQRFDDDIAESVAAELNYSAHLDSSILKAIESDELNSDEDRRVAREVLVSPKSAQLHQQLDAERRHVAQLTDQLAADRAQAGAAQQQDAAVIDAMRQRLQAAVANEQRLQLQLADERSKVDRLATQVLVHQRSSSAASQLLKSPGPDSPRRLARSAAGTPTGVGSAADAEQIGRLQSEIRLLTSQAEREKERLQDTERQLEREKVRFETELADRKEHGNRLRAELDRVLEEKRLLAGDLDAVQERLQLAADECGGLEARIGALQEAEERRAAARRGRERTESAQQAVDVQELRLRLAMVERERDQLGDRCTALRADVERGAQREAQLTEALMREHAGDGMVPQQFLQKLASIAENTREYRQMAQTLQLLTEERQALQQRVDDLELRNRAFNRDELEKRANHLFGKFLRVESFRKALVHQKRYLLIMLQTYQENEAKALAMIKGIQPQPPKKKSFRSAVLVVIAIERMKYIVKRWQTGKRVGSEAIFSHQLPRRSASASTNIWANAAAPATMSGQSPPCRDRPPYHPSGINRSGSVHAMMRPLAAPALIAECSERMEQQHQQPTRRHW